jgi:hypothetical protein
MTDFFVKAEPNLRPVDILIVMYFQLRKLHKSYVIVSALHPAMKICYDELLRRRIESVIGILHFIPDPENPTSLHCVELSDSIVDWAEQGFGIWNHTDRIDISMIYTHFIEELPVFEYRPLLESARVACVGYERLTRKPERLLRR